MISATVALFLTLPALCLGGVITHACDCAVETSPNCEAGSEHESGRKQHHGGCGHEGSCSDDPCSIQVVQTDRQNGDFVAVSQPSASTPIILTTVNQPSALIVIVGARNRFGDEALPFPSSDLPLQV